MFSVSVTGPTAAILLCDRFEKQMLYQFFRSLKTYLEVVRMGFSTFKPWWYLLLWCSSSNILSWECTEVSSGRPSARAAASKASWHSICFYKTEKSDFKTMFKVHDSQLQQLCSSLFCKVLHNSNHYHLNVLEDRLQPGSKEIEGTHSRSASDCCICKTLINTSIVPVH